MINMEGYGPWTRGLRGFSRRPRETPQERAEIEIEPEPPAEAEAGGDVAEEGEDEQPGESLSDPKRNLGGRPSEPDAQHKVAEVVGVDEATLIRAKHHAATIEKYPL